MLLSNNRDSFELYEWLKSNGVNVYYYSDKISKEQLIFLRLELTINYNYSYIVNDEIIASLYGKIINMHISYLPWNRGSVPNFWSFIDDTPKGFTIHMLEKGGIQERLWYRKKFFSMKRRKHLNPHINL